MIDATGKLVFPGFIDPHVHIHLPFMATFAKDTHATASKAALVGGTTTFIEMCCPSRKDDALEGYHMWKQKAEGNSACDYAFHMAVTRYDARDGSPAPGDRHATAPHRSRFFSPIRIFSASMTRRCSTRSSWPPNWA